MLKCRSFLSGGTWERTGSGGGEYRNNVSHGNCSGDNESGCGSGSDCSRVNYVDEVDNTSVGARKTNCGLDDDGDCNDVSSEDDGVRLVRVSRRTE